MIRVTVLAKQAWLFHALRSITGNHYVSHFHSRYSLSNTLNHCGGLVSQNTGVNSFGVSSFNNINIGVAEGIRNNFDSNFSSFGGVNKYVLYD